MKEQELWEGRKWTRSGEKGKKESNRTEIFIKYGDIYNKFIMKHSL